MRGLRPSSGASSIAPFSLTHSAWTPRAPKWALVMLGYLVATRTWLQARGIVGCGQLGGLGDAQAAAPDAQVDGGIDLGEAELHQHVVARDAELRRAERHEGRDVEGADPDQADALEGWSRS